MNLRRENPQNFSYPLLSQGQACPREGGEQGVSPVRAFSFRASNGVRWRFHRLFNHVYVEAFETILFLEKVFGTQLREYAVRISGERHKMRREIRNTGFQSAADISRK